MNIVSIENSIVGICYKKESNSMITKREVGTLVLHLGYRKVERGYFYYYYYKYKKQWDLQLTIFLEISDS